MNLKRVYKRYRHAKREHEFAAADYWWRRSQVKQQRTFARLATKVRRQGDKLLLAQEIRETAP